MIFVGCGQRTEREHASVTIILGLVHLSVLNIGMNLLSVEEKKRMLDLRKCCEVESSSRDRGTDGNRHAGLPRSLC